MTVVPILGVTLPEYLPAVLIILICSNFFGLYGAVLKFIGCSVYLFAKDFYSDKVEDGRKNVETFKKRVKQHQALYAKDDIIHHLLTSENMHLGLFISDRQEVKTNIFSQTIDEHKKKVATKRKGSAFGVGKKAKK